VCIFPRPVRLSFNFSNFKARYQLCVSVTHSNHLQVVYQTYKRKFFPFLFKVVYTLIMLILKQPKHVAAIYKCCIKVVQWQIVFLYSYSIIIPLSTVYSRAIVIQNPTSNLTGACGGAVGWGSLEMHKVGHIYSNSVPVGRIHPLNGGDS
jgi:hypothetical protein